MNRKVNQVLYRINQNTIWKSQWCTNNKKLIKKNILEDIVIIRLLNNELSPISFQVMDYIIKRTDQILKIFIYTKNKYAFIGKNGVIINSIIEKIKLFTNDRIIIKIFKCHNNIMTSFNICNQLKDSFENDKFYKKIISFVKKNISFSKIYDGFKIQIKGLLNGSLKKRKMIFQDGSTKMKNFNKYIDYYFINYKSKRDGIYGIKVWLSYKSNLDKKTTFLKNI